MKGLRLATSSIGATDCGVFFPHDPAPDSLSVPTRASCVPNTDRPLQIPCPKCEHTACTLVVKSISDMTVKCPNCGHSWATELEALPEDIQMMVRAVLRDD
jgi:ribosomal protein S27E